MKTIASSTDCNSLTEDARIFANNVPANLFNGIDTATLVRAATRRQVSQDLTDILMEELDRANYAALVNGSNELEPTDDDMFALAILLAYYQLFTNILEDFHATHVAGRTGDPYGIPAK